MTIRPARPDDFIAIQSIEAEAGTLFAGIGMQAIADDDPFSIAELQAFSDAGHAWVAVDPDDRPVGYLVADLVDGRAHIEQLSVRPTHGRQGIGRSLVGYLLVWAAARQLTAVTLTTFLDVPWNAPLYERLGFRQLGAEEMGEGLRRIRAREADAGLDRWPRTAMIREVARTAQS
jgi:ribosomal protein S18 acetylase RimI-like enzyme